MVLRCCAVQATCRGPAVQRAPSSRRVVTDGALLGCRGPLPMPRKTTFLRRRCPGGCACGGPLGVYGTGPVTLPPNRPVTLHTSQSLFFLCFFFHGISTLSPAAVAGSFSFAGGRRELVPYSQALRAIDVLNLAPRALCLLLCRRFLRLFVSCWSFFRYNFFA